MQLPNFISVEILVAIACSVSTLTKLSENLMSTATTFSSHNALLVFGAIVKSCGPKVAAI
ncbi:MAG: hypothetical protein DKT66_00520 [Candidatus Melainabacteria bacterium]|nr:MAG: hypothetical protein DKT66_00520 [Candidatus Melainabacteria bacterium]